MVYIAEKNFLYWISLPLEINIYRWILILNKFYLKIEKELISRKKSYVNDMSASNKNLNIKIEDKKYKIAAVLFPLIEKNKKVNVILTTRSKDVASHPGQVCFPGGKLDKKDKNIVDCAKREAFEEVGIKNNQIKILGQIDQCITGTNYKVTPIIALINSNYIPLIQESEVADLFEVPFEFFLDKNNLKRKNAEYKGKHYSYYQYNWKNKKIWGSTARMIVNFCEIMKLY
jgi:8-oxo-dGTP pyrophosphatase MutT (NUDIX family)